MTKQKITKGMPKVGQLFYWHKATGGLTCDTWTGQEPDLDLWNFGNVFLTEAECQKEIERRKVLQRVKVWIAENTEPLQDGELQMFLTYAPHLKKFTTREVGVYDPVGLALPYLRSSDAARLIKSCESDLRTLAGVE